MHKRLWRAATQAVTKFNAFKPKSLSSVLSLVGATSITAATYHATSIQTFASPLDPVAQANPEPEPSPVVESYPRLRTPSTKQHPDRTHVEKALRTMYDEIEPYNTGWVKTDDGKHELYFEEVGNPKGKPVIFLHGGPCGGICPDYRRFFDPEFYRVILFDQRGAGNSNPNASMEANTTWHCVSDIEQLRDHFGVDKWHMVFGGSWGSTLALAYSEKYPSRVKSLVLRGIFLFQGEDMHWLFQHGASEHYPDKWVHFMEHIPVAERGNLLDAYYRRVMSDDPDVYIPASENFVRWELSISKLHYDHAAIEHELEDPKYVVPFARAECHYFHHKGWFRSSTQLLDEASKISHIPTAIVHGRYDLVCQPRAAHELHMRLANSSLEFVYGGHSMMETEVVDALIRATDDMRQIP